MSVPAAMVSWGLWVTAWLSGVPLGVATPQKELFQQSAGSGTWANGIGERCCGYM